MLFNSSQQTVNQPIRQCQRQPTDQTVFAHLLSHTDLLQPACVRLSLIPCTAQPMNGPHFGSDAWVAQEGPFSAGDWADASLVARSRVTSQIARGDWLAKQPWQVHIRGQSKALPAATDADAPLGAEQLLCALAGAATSDVAVLHYFPARGRAEPIRWGAAAHAGRAQSSPALGGPGEAHMTSFTAGQCCSV